MEIGKLTNAQLEEIIFSKIKYKHSNVLIGSGVGEDCSIIDFKRDLCVISTDPITATTKDIGRLAVHVSCNDVASKGIKPFAIMITLLAPPSCSLEEIQKVMEDMIDTTNELSIQIIGGHTEITDAVNRMVISTTCIGAGSKDNLILGTDEISPGDVLLMTKFAACEGTTILYNDFQKQLMAILSDEDLKQLNILSESVSVIEEGVIAAQVGVKIMHDVTEGGILGAAWEIAEKTQLGLKLDIQNIPLLDVTQKITAFFHMDPYKLISSGVMLMVASQEKSAPLREELIKKGIKATAIGEFYKGDSIITKKDGNITHLIPPKCDELYNAYR
ncbi:MAG: AIR synthase family protein [Eubacteriales bacterium]